MLADWVLTAAPGFDSQGDGDNAFQALPPRMTEDFAVDALEALEAVVTFARSPLAAVREARAWREVIAPTQQQTSGSSSSNNSSRGRNRSGGEKQQPRSVPELSGLTHASHLLSLVGCCPSGELEAAFPSLARELLLLLRQRQHPSGGGGVSGGAAAAGGCDDDDDANDGTTRAVALAAVDEAVRRLLHDAGRAVPSGGGGGGGSGGGGGGKSKVGGGGEAEGVGRQAVIAVLPKLVPAVTACLEGSTSADGASSLPPPPAVAAGALGVLEALVFLLRSTMRPHVKKVEAATAPWLQGPSDVIRDRAAAVLASLPLCGEAEAWTQAAGRVALEAHGLLHAAWPDNDVDMGTSDSMSASQLDAALGSGAGLLPPLGGGAGEGFSGPQQVLASLVSRRFKGLCHVLELMLTGDSNGRPVAVPVGLILALVERVQRMVSSVVKGQGPQVFIPVAQGALSHGALSVIRPSLGLAASRLLHALATTEASTVLRNARRFCRALVQGMAKPSDAGSLRAAGYRAVSRAVLQLGEGAAPYLATPALPAILAEIRSAVAASEPEAAGGGGGAGGDSSFEVVAATGAPGVAAVGGGSKKGMGIEPAMSARKSSQKKQRRSREKEVGRALAAADAAAAATATAASNGGGSGGGGGGGAGRTGAAALAEEQAVCAGLSCLSRVVVCCKGHLPLGGRLAVEQVLHRGLELLAHAGGAVKGSRGDGGGGGGGGASGGRRRCARLEDPRVAREFLGLAHACLMTPLADGTRSGSLSVAIAAFRSFASHPDQRLAAASQQALAGCGAVLYPRAAPLHLPHAVTSQARAWGGSSASSTGRGLPMGWGDTLMVAEGESAEEESQEDLEDYQHPGRGVGAAGGGGMALTVRAAELAAEGLTAAAVAGPIVTPPPPPPPPAAAQTAALEEGGHFPQTFPRDASSTSAAAAASAGADNGDAATTSKSGSGKGKGKGKGRVGGGAAGGGGSGDGGSSAGAGAAGTVEEDGHNDNEAAAAAATAGTRKRPRNDGDGDGDDARNAMDDEEEEEEEEEKAAVVAPRGAAASEGGGVPAVVKQTQQPVAAVLGGGDEDDDDDDFEFPAIVDADPDVE